MASPDDSDSFEESEDSQDPQLTELVAYLDGELSDEENNRLERDLASNGLLRRYAESLDRTWQLLDSLGETTASGEFTQKTMASLNAVSGASHDVSKASPGSRRFHSWKRPLVAGILWTLAGFISCSAGLLLSRSAQSSKKGSDDEQILRQLRLLKEFPRMYSVPDADFLRRVMTLNGQPTTPEVEAP